MEIDTLYLIKEKKSFDYWNNKTGYGSIKTADIFENTNFNLPIGGAWVKLSDAIIDFLNQEEL